MKSALLIERRKLLDMLKHKNRNVFLLGKIITLKKKEGRTTLMLELLIDKSLAATTAEIKMFITAKKKSMSACSYFNE